MSAETQTSLTYPHAHGTHISIQWTVPVIGVMSVTLQRDFKAAAVMCMPGLEKRA